MNMDRIRRVKECGGGAPAPRCPVDGCGKILFTPDERASGKCSLHLAVERMNQAGGDLHKATFGE